MSVTSWATTFHVTVGTAAAEFPQRKQMGPAHRRSMRIVLLAVIRTETALPSAIERMMPEPGRSIWRAIWESRFGTTE